ncbi:RhoGAP domain protein [Dictyocaulus viviparus]|uniref:RhoGAP domain protein n=1 Tax=Dictyocaulus viviparus TaxID=29172 RepID=A0A0D8Y153_DICVI|nr:RhoGAP domain protein [Dictyocaulus viviparus]
MSSNQPVPKPRTRFNVGAKFVPCSKQANEMVSNITGDGFSKEVATTASSERAVDNNVECSQPTLLCYHPSPPPRLIQLTSEMKAGILHGLYTCQPSHAKMSVCGIEFVENPIYMSLFSFRKISSDNDTENTEVNSHSKSFPSNSTNSEICGSFREDASNFVNEKKHSQQFVPDISCLPGSSNSALERNIPLDRRVLSSHVENLEHRYTPSPQRCFSTKKDSCGSNSLLEKFEGIVETADSMKTSNEYDNSYDENCSGDHFDSTAVAYFGDVLLHVGKKDKKKSEECIAGPFSLMECELIHRDEQVVTIKLSEKEDDKVVIFTAENDAETWALLLGECWLLEYDILRSSIKEATLFGTFWLRQGTTGEWIYTAAVLSGKTMFYILLESSDYIYEMDVRKVILLRDRVDKVDWCPKCRKKDQKGPFLISLEGCALYVECCDDLSTKKWFSALQDVLSMPSTVLEDCRLTADNIPIVLVDKCIRFVAVYGIHSEGIYRRNGKKTETNDIFKRLTEDPVQTHIASTSEETVYAVADCLRQFFRRLKSPLFPHAIHKEIFEYGKSFSSDSA